MIEYKTLYRRDSKGRLRSWRMEVNGERYFSTSGIVGGTMFTTPSTVATERNVGRSNYRDAEAQAIFEVEAEYTKKRSEGWSDTIPDGNAMSVTGKFSPMLAHSYSDHLKKIVFPLFTQPKLDGIRCVARADGLWTRNGKPIFGVPHIARSLEPVFERHPDLVLDGELYNHDLRNDFEKIVSIVKKQQPTIEDLIASQSLMQYHVYDCVIGTTDDRVFSDRWLARAEWSIYLPEDAAVYTVLTNSAAHQDDLDTQYGQYLELGYEGQMIRFNEAYENRRTSKLLKRKEFLDEECTITGVEEGNGTWGGTAKKLLMVRDNGIAFESNIRGNRETLADILRDPTQVIGKRATVRYQNLLASGKPRFPVVVQIDRID